MVRRAVLGGRRLVAVLAAQVVARATGEVPLENAKAWVRRLDVGVAENVPPDVGRPKVGAANLVPELLSVLGAGHGLVLLRTVDWPASLSDPDLLVTSGFLGLLEGSIEEVGTIVNTVGLGVLKVGIGVHADPVACVDEGAVGAVGVGGPGVDVTDGGTAQASVLDGITNTADVANKSVGVGAGVLIVLEASGRVAVEILATDRDTNDKIVELVTVLLDGLLESIDLVAEGLIAS